MKRFYIQVSNPGASRHAYFSGMAATLAAFNLALTAATPEQPRDDSRIAAGHIRNMAVGESYAAKRGPHGADAPYTVKVGRVR